MGFHLSFGCCTLISPWSFRFFPLWYHNAVVVISTLIGLVSSLLIQKYHGLIQPAEVQLQSNRLTFTHDACFSFLPSVLPPPTLLLSCRKILLNSSASNSKMRWSRVGTTPMEMEFLRHPAAPGDERSDGHRNPRGVFLLTTIPVGRLGFCW